MTKVNKIKVRTLSNGNYQIVVYDP